MMPDGPGEDIAVPGGGYLQYNEVRFAMVEQTSADASDSTSSMISLKFVFAICSWLICKMSLGCSVHVQMVTIYSTMRLLHYHKRLE